MDDEAATSFFDFLQRVTPRYLQEREVGLDVYLSGAWGWLPVALGVAAATIFVLALFHVIPLRRHSIPLVLAAGVVAFGIGLLGTYVNYRRVEFDDDGAIVLEKPPPRIFTDGKGRAPETDGHGATLLAAPLLVSGAVLVACLGAGGFLMVFGGRERKREEEEDDDDDE